MNTVEGKITNTGQEGLFTVQAEGLKVPKGGARVWLQVLPERTIIPKQRRLCWALLKEIARWQKEACQSVNEQRKIDFLLREMGQHAVRVFSLSDAPEPLASDYLRYLVHFVIDHGIPTQKPLIAYTADTTDYLHYLAKNRKCAVCGKEAYLIALDAEGIAPGQRVIPLCFAHQSEMVAAGVEKFLGKYRFREGIRLTGELARVYGLHKKGVLK